MTTKFKLQVEKDNTAHVWGLWKQNVSLSQLQESSYTLCYAAKWHGEDYVWFDSVNDSSPEEMVRGVWELLDEADAIVHYNGTKFDIPTLNKEFIIYGMNPPSGYNQIDLLKVARQQFRFPSNKLDYVAQQLGVGEKHKHIGHELWVKCMAGDQQAWSDMADYNIQDVWLLEEVYNKLLPWIKTHPNHALFTDIEKPTCPNCGGTHLNSKGYQTTKTQKYRRYVCQDCGTYTRERFTAVNKIDRKNILVQA